MHALVKQSVALVRRFMALARRLCTRLLVQSQTQCVRGFEENHIPKNAMYFPGRERLVFFRRECTSEIPIRISPQEEFLQYFAAGVTSAFPLRTDAVILPQPP